MDNRTSVALERVLISVQEDGPAVDTGTLDAEVLSLALRLNLPVDAVTVVKYLAERGPRYDDMEDNAWNTAFASEDGNNPNEHADDTLCPYDKCDGYSSEPVSHSPTCPYVLAMELLRQWRNT